MPLLQVRSPLREALTELQQLHSAFHGRRLTDTYRASQANSLDEIVFLDHGKLQRAHTRLEFVDAVRRQDWTRAEKLAHSMRI